jgi:hypothetical protein
LPPNAATGASKTAAITLSIGIMNEDRSLILTGHGPENITHLRRFAISIIKFKDGRSAPQKMRQLMLKLHLVFEYLWITEI